MSFRDWIEATFELGPWTPFIWVANVMILLLAFLIGAAILQCFGIPK